MRAADYPAPRRRRARLVIATLSDGSAYTPNTANVRLPVCIFVIMWDTERYICCGMVWSFAVAAQRNWADTHPWLEDDHVAHAISLLWLSCSGHISISLGMLRATSSSVAGRDR